MIEPLLCCQPFFDVEPGPCHQVHRQTVEYSDLKSKRLLFGHFKLQTYPRKERLLKFALNKESEKQYGEEEADADASGVVEEGVPAEGGRHAEEDQSCQGGQQEEVVDMLPLEGHLVFLQNIMVCRFVLNPPT